MRLKQKLKELIQQEQNNGLKLNLRQISEKTGIEYNRFWRFCTKPNFKLTLEEAEIIYETLSGKPLIASK